MTKFNHLMKAHHEHDAKFLQDFQSQLKSHPEILIPLAAIQAIPVAITTAGLIKIVINQQKLKIEKEKTRQLELQTKQQADDSGCHCHQHGSGKHKHQIPKAKLVHP